ncbi:hypothetical protein [Rhodococcus sp. PvP104]|uniref:hypothetical protein n=1 Tax=Rhodococcus sp. PvP104 TaxID=2817911 RepID=UPI001AE3A478|nr:hypothetical protein [Rhodococcus sp. PvP104]MBP2522801.1 hypothetical protein [Rhodococcus sp. PvP104]
MSESLKLMEINLIEKLSGQRTSDEDHGIEYAAAIGYVISLRKLEGKGRDLGLAQHKAMFDEYMWNTTTEELNEASKLSGLYIEDEEDLAKKD